MNKTTLLHPIDSQKEIRMRKFLRVAIWIFLLLTTIILLYSEILNDIKMFLVKHPLYSSIIIVALLFVFIVESKFLRRTKFIGEWNNKEGAVLELLKNGLFCGVNLPKRIFTTEPSDLSERIIISGTWKLIGSNYAPLGARLITPKERIILKYEYNLSQNKILKYELEIRTSDSVYSKKSPTKLSTGFQGDYNFTKKI